MEVEFLLLPIEEKLKIPFSQIVESVEAAGCMLLSKPDDPVVRGGWLMYTCATCGESFSCNYGNFINQRQHRCKVCSRAVSAGEYAVSKVLAALGVAVEKQYTFPDCCNKQVLHFDFAVVCGVGSCPVLLIEYDGKHHFSAVEFWGGQEAFEYRKHNDHIKDSYCKDHGIPLLRISYKQFDQIEQLVTDKLYELNILQKEAA